MSEPMDRSRRIFVDQGTFEQAFPDVEEARIEYTEFEYGNEKRDGGWDLRDGGLMRCGNPRCRRGGYELDLQVIHKMVREHATEKEFQLSCPGDEGTPQGRQRGRSCAFSIKGKATVKYK